MKTKMIFNVCVAFLILMLVATPALAGCGCAANAAADTNAQVVNVQNPDEVPTMEELRNAVTGLQVQAQSMDLEGILEGVRMEPEEALQELAKRREIQAAAFRNLATDVRFKAGQIEADNQTFQNVRTQVRARLANQEVDVEIGEDEVTLVQNQWRVQAQELELVDLKLRFRNQELKASPESAVAASGVTPEEIELTLEDGKPAYALRYRVQRKLFGLFDVAATKTAVLDASTPSPALIRERTPFWYFLTTE